MKTSQITLYIHHGCVFIIGGSLGVVLLVIIGAASWTKHCYFRGLNYHCCYYIGATLSTVILMSYSIVVIFQSKVPTLIDIINWDTSYIVSSGGALYQALFGGEPSDAFISSESDLSLSYVNADWL